MFFRPAEEDGLGTGPVILPPQRVRVRMNADPTQRCCRACVKTGALVYLNTADDAMLNILYSDTGLCGNYSRLLINYKM